MERQLEEEIQKNKIQIEENPNQKPLLIQNRLNPHKKGILFY